MEFRVSRDYTISGLPVPVVAGPSSEAGSFIAHDAVEGPLATRELGFTGISDADIAALDRGDTSAMDKYVIGPDASGLYTFVDCGANMATSFGSVSVSSVIETS